MTIIEIAALENGAHRNQTGAFAVIPDGWAAIPAGMTIPETFPFVEVSAEGGVVTSLAAGTVPEPEPAPEPEPTVEERVNALEAENKELRAKLAAAVESGTMLEDCIVEMAGVVYA